ncbi:MAG: glycosyltransferase family 4 protein [Candidatus Marinimicrobia bacterium]|nr:glycosyltransferase family 4 protein [Candidatus Neomarinimicrobiota bacterium]
MKIGIDARMIDNEFTGIGRYSYSFLRALGQIDCQNEYLIFKNSRYKKPLTSGPNFHEIEVNIPKFDIREHLFFYRKMKEEKIDILHSLHYVGPLLGTHKLIVTIHDLMAIMFPDFFSAYSSITGKILKNYLKLLVYLTLERVDGIITVSKWCKSDLTKYFKISKNEIFPIYEAVEKHFRPINNKGLQTSIKKKYQLPSKFFLYVGNMRPYKNLKRLIDAYQIFFKNYKAEIDLVIAGSKKDKHYGQLFNYVISNKLEEKVHFTGYVNENDLPILMSSAECFIFPSLCEGFGFPPLEAMACGTPVITSNVSSLPEIVNGAGILVNPYDVHEIAKAMFRVISDKSLRKTLIHKGIERSKQFSWEKCAKETLLVYEKVFKQVK